LTSNNSGFARILEISDASKFNSEGNVFNEPNVPKPVYPIDLSIIAARIKNRFYRRTQQIEFDIEKLLSNVKNELIHENYDDLLIKAELITDVCRKFIRDTDCQNPITIYEQQLDQINLQKVQTQTQQEIHSNNVLCRN